MVSFERVENEGCSDEQLVSFRGRMSTDSQVPTNLLSKNLQTRQSTWRAGDGREVSCLCVYAEPSRGAAEEEHINKEKCGTELSRNIFRKNLLPSVRLELRTTKFVPASHLKPGAMLDFPPAL